MHFGFSRCVQTSTWQYRSTFSIYLWMLGQVRSRFIDPHPHPGSSGNSCGSGLYLGIGRQKEPSCSFWSSPRWCQTYLYFSKTSKGCWKTEQWSLALNWHVGVKENATSTKIRHCQGWLAERLNSIFLNSSQLCRACIYKISVWTLKKLDVKQ